MKGFPHQLMYSDAPIAFTSTSVSIATPLSQLHNLGYQEADLSTSSHMCSAESDSELCELIMYGWIASRFLRCCLFSVFSRNSHWIKPLLPSGGPFCVKCTIIQWTAWTETLSKLDCSLAVCPVRVGLIRSSQAEMFFPGVDS